MNIEKRLEHLIFANYKNMREFANAAEVPYTTVVSMLERGIMKAGIGTIIKICKCLNISADGLADGEIFFLECSWYLGGFFDDTGYQ